MRKITWEQVSKLCKRLGQKIRECDKQPQVIFGIPRGGLPVAVHLSHLTGIPLVMEADTSTEVQYTIVDDINDTGRTMRRFSNLDNCLTIVLFERVDSEVKADIVGEYIQHNDWIVFPWEDPNNAFDDMLQYLEEGNRSALHKAKR